MKREACKSNSKRCAWEILGAVLSRHGGWAAGPHNYLQAEEHGLDGGLCEGQWRGPKARWTRPEFLWRDGLEGPRKEGEI